MAEDIDKLILDLIDPNLDIPGSMRPLRHAASLALRSQQSRIKELEQSNDEEAAAMLAAAPTAPAAVGGGKKHPAAVSVPQDIWNALRERCCSTRPSSDAKAVVMVRQEDIVAAVQKVDQLQRERGAVAGQDGSSVSCARKGTGPAATLSLSERVPTASDDVVGAMATVIASAMDHCETHNVSCGEPSEFIARAVLSSPPVREIVGALRTLRLTAAVLQQNSEGCAVNHHSVDFEQQGLPGWLVDTQKDIDRARSILSRFQSVGGEKHDHADGTSVEAVEKVTQVDERRQ